MKIGMIFESGLQGADKLVCEYLAKNIRQGVSISSATHFNKAEMIANCGRDVVHLLSEGCDRIMIIWDLYPPWRTKRESPCRKLDREAIFSSLKLAGVEHAPVVLVCIREELESWLLTDGPALAAVLSTKTHKVRNIPSERNPDYVGNPKGRLKRLFRTHNRGAYNELVHSIKIIKAADLNRLRNSESFCRFENKLTS